MPFASPHVADNGEAVPRVRPLSRSTSYIPYGEVFVEESAAGWQSPYYFNAKELDNETGLYYYGARYLDPTGAMWLSVDPMWENRPGISPFNYCLSNPIKMIDPDGMWEQDADGNWIAQKNDNAYTLAKALNVNPSDAIQMMKDQGFEFTEGDKKVNLQIGDKFTSGGNGGFNGLNFEYREYQGSIFGGYPIETGLEDASLIPFFDPIIEKIGDVAANVLQYFGVKEESSYQITAMAMMLCPLKGGIKGGKTPKIHGNSLSSPRPTWGYKLYDKNSGEFLKNLKSANRKIL